MASEREIVGRLLARTGIANDDAALIGKLALTTDVSFASSHSPAGLSYYNMGWRSAASNISDLAAMGAKPIAFLLAQGLPEKIAAGASEQISRGILDSCKFHKAKYLGGDTKKAKEITLAGFALGKISGKPLLRSNARAGDIICISGEIGNAFCGFHALTHNKTKNTPKKLLNAFLKPTARIAEGIAASSSAKRAACMDVSDGLLFTCSEIARLSKVRMDVESMSIPISNEARKYCAENGIDAGAVIDWGEDYALVFSMGQKDFAKICKKAKLVCIGYASKGSGLHVDGEKYAGTGYDAFL